MENVQFDESEQANTFTSRKIFGDPTVPTMSRLFIKLGLAKDSKQAEYVMIVIIIICLLVTFYSLSKVFWPSLLPF